MDKKTAQKLKQLTLNEIDFRKKWRNAVSVLQNLVQPVTNHNQECCEFWNANLPNETEITIIFDNNTTLKIKKPEREVATQEAYLPYGIDFVECKLFDIASD